MLLTSQLLMFSVILHLANEKESIPIVVITEILKTVADVWLGFPNISLKTSFIYRATIWKPQLMCPLSNHDAPFITSVVSLSGHSSHNQLVSKGAEGGHKSGRKTNYSVIKNEKNTPTLITCFYSRLTLWGHIRQHICLANTPLHFPIVSNTQANKAKDGQRYTHATRIQRQDSAATPRQHIFRLSTQPRKPWRMSWGDGAREISAGSNTLEAGEVRRLDLSLCIARGQVFREPRRANEKDIAGRVTGKKLKKEERT